jgi:hypothetical protein
MLEMCFGTGDLTISWALYLVRILMTGNMTSLEVLFEIK